VSVSAWKVRVSNGSGSARTTSARMRTDEDEPNTVFSRGPIIAARPAWRPGTTGTPYGSPSDVTFVPQRRYADTMPMDGCSSATRTMSSRAFG
jgi:hypothetical protein